MKKTCNNRGADIPTKNNVTDPAVLGHNGQATGNACLSDKGHHDSVCNESKQTPLEIICDFAEIALTNGEFQFAKSTLDLGVREGHVQAMWALALMLIYGFVPGVDFDLDIYPLVYKAATLLHIPSMWMLTQWHDDGIIVRKDALYADFLRLLLSKLDPNEEHYHPLIAPDVVAEGDNSILVHDVINALEYNPDEVYVPVSDEEFLNMIFTNE